MPDPLSIVTGAVALVTTAFSLCQGLYEAVDGMIEAPKHLQVISHDLKGFYSVLGTLDGYLRDEDMVLGVLHPSTSEDLSAVLTNCVSIFKDLQVIMKEFFKEFSEVEGENVKEKSAKRRPTKDKPVKPKMDVTKWNSIRSTWKEKEIRNLREHLAAHKITLNVTIAMANLINTSTTRASTQRIEEDVQQLKENLTLLLVRLETAENRYEESGIILDNYTVTIRRFARGADSIMTAATIERPPSPSAIVSFTLPSVASRSTYETAPTSQHGTVLPSVCSCSTYETALSTLKCLGTISQSGSPVAGKSDDSDARSMATVRATDDDGGSKLTATLRPLVKGIITYQIFVKGLTAHTLVLFVDSSWLVYSILNILSEKTGIPPDRISVTFNGRILKRYTSIGDSKISSNSTLHANINAFWETSWQDEVWETGNSRRWSITDSSSYNSWADSSLSRSKRSLGWYGRREEATRNRYIDFLKKSTPFWRQKDLG